MSWNNISMMEFELPENIVGLGAAELAIFSELCDIFAKHTSANAEKEKYYEGNVQLSEVNLGIALPDGMQGLEIGCAWGANAVDVMAARSVFDGYVGENGELNDLMNKIVAENNLIAEYHKACRDELKFGCTFATLSGNDKGTCTIRFHSPQTAAAKWDGAKGRIAYGMAIVAINYDPDGLAYPTVINLYTDNAIWVLTLNETTNVWHAIGHLHKMGRPLMEPLVWNATSKKPLGRSRLKKPVRELIKSYVRTVANATIGLEFATSPQKYLLGVTDEQYDAVVNSKFKQYVGSILAATTNPDNGEKPSFGQLSQGNIQPHVEMLRILSTQFSAATGLSVSDTGVVNDANPTSSEAITAQTKTLVGKAEELNDGNGQSLRIIALMAQAIALNKTLDELDETQTAVVAHFKNPAMPNIATTTDAAIKISSVRQGFAQTDIFLEMVGFDQADIRRIKAQEAKARGLDLVTELVQNE